MRKTAVALLIVWMTLSFSFAQEGKKGIRIKKTKGNAGKRWAICIGINDYEDNTILDLKKARNDAKELGKVLKQHGQFDRVYVMTDDLDARKENYPKLRNIKNKLKYLEGFIEPEDLVLFSFSGHGVAHSNGDGFLVTADSYCEELFETSLGIETVVKWLKDLKVKKSLLLLDACRETFQVNKGINKDGLKAERFEQAEVAAVFYATRSGWFSYEDTEGRFGVFSRYIIDGLKGGADSTQIEGNEDGIVTFSELASYVEIGVSDWALDKGKKQRPYTGIFGEKYGDLALSAYQKKGYVEKEGVEIKEQIISDDKPADVKAVESKGWRVYENDNGFWEAEYEDGIVMVYIPEGEFTMGSNDGEDDEKPPHQVYLDGYWMGKTEVTFEQYDKYCAEAGKTKPDDRRWGRGTRPIIYVSWNDADEYCKWLSEKIGLKFKLPTEAQWENAARGIKGRKYPWGNKEPDEALANFGGKVGKTTPVGSYPQGASPYGILNMAGNVWEWCNDWCGGYDAGRQKNPKDPENGTYRVVRGGGWDYYASYLRCAYRYYGRPSNRFSSLGFRLSQDN